MERYDLVGKDGNAYAVMGYVCSAMEDAFREACKTVDETAMKLFDKAAQDVYIKDATSSDYSHLLCVSVEMLDKVNEWFENQPSFEGWEEDDDYYDEDDEEY